MLTGGCMCSGIRYEISQPLVSAGYCHCTRCQRRTGTAASASGRITPGSLRIVRGEELLRAWKPADGYTKVFCAECGSHMWSEHPDHPAQRFVRLGSLDSDPGIRPSYRQYVDYAAVWEPLPDDGLPRFPERRPATE
jgi:hypothetical protein